MMKNYMMKIHRWPNDNINAYPIENTSEILYEINSLLNFLLSELLVANSFKMIFLASLS